ncbi:MAG: glycosyltransferase family 4 protein, partial [Verrucomicrobiota bacterium]
RIYNAVDRAGLSASASGVEVVRPDDAAPRVGCIGQIALRKGQDVFLKAAALVPDVHYFVVGERFSAKEESRAYEEELHALASVPALTGRVGFTGYLNHVPAFLRTLDLVVVPSRQEPLSRVMLEALAMGVPVVATDVGGASEIIEHGTSGWLTPPDNPEAMAEAISEILASRELRDRFRSEGFKRAEAFSPQKQADALMTLYRDVLRKGDLGP